MKYSHQNIGICHSGQISQQLLLVRSAGVLELKEDDEVEKKKEISILTVASTASWMASTTSSTLAASELLLPASPSSLARNLQMWMKNKYSKI